MQLRLWDLVSGECLYIFKGHCNKVKILSLTPDGMFLVSGCFDETLRFWDLETGECIATYQASYSVLAISILLVSKRIICGTADGQVHFLTPVNFPPFGLAIITALSPREARCIYCANKFAPPPAVLQAISDKLDPEEKESALNTACPHCNGKLKFNPFYVHNYDTTN